jgi:choline-sulfatase
VLGIGLAWIVWRVRPTGGAAAVVLAAVALSAASPLALPAPGRAVTTAAVREARGTPTPAAAAARTPLPEAAATATRAGGQPAPAAASPTLAAPSPTAGRPAPGTSFEPPMNVVLITVDTLRADRIGACRDGVTRTPNIDALAAEGILSCRATVTQPASNTSHASMLTGLTPNAHGIRVHLIDRLKPGVPTLAEALRERGYHTAAIYSWMSFNPAFSGLDRGFESYEGYVVNLPQAGDVPAVQFLGATYRRLKEYLTIARTTDMALKLEDVVETTADGRADVTTDAAVRWLGERDSRPFFLWLHYFDPHYPYTPPPPYDTIYDPEYQGTIDGTIRTVWAIRDGELAPTPRDVEHLVALYRGEIAFADAQIGRFLGELDARGLRENTIIVVAGDHGESFGEHDAWVHVGLHAPEIEVPVIVRAPGRAPATEITTPASTLDLAPTILDLLGAPALPGARGQSLVPIAERRVDGASRVLFTHFHDDWYVAATGHEWKLIADIAEGKHELYHLPSDPTESINRIGEAARDGSPAAQAWAELSSALTTYLEEENVKRRGPLRLPA